VSQVTSFNSVFQDAKTFNEQLTMWNTSSANRMDSMFLRAYAFNQPVDHFLTGKVNSMAIMFQDARAFNQPLTSWDTSLVNRMDSMFFRAYAFNQPVVSELLSTPSRFPSSWRL
jgi:surface protein